MLLTNGLAIAILQLVRRTDSPEERRTTPARWEVGGEFHWMGRAPGPFVAWPMAGIWYLLGRHTVAALLQSLRLHARRLWLPSYFCFDIKQFWKQFSDVVQYHDNPLRAEPDWATLRPDPYDLVVAVNYFGARAQEPWRKWRNRNECVLVEDHSHDPVSGWALHSTADYAFASLRKTFPVPDGGLLWSPRGLPLPMGGVGESSGSLTKLAAMLWKREYLFGDADPEIKATYRRWQQEGEHAFEKATIAFASDVTQTFASSGVPKVWRERRRANTQYLLAALPKNAGRPVFSSWPEGAAPLGVVLEFPSQHLRDACRLKLQQQNVYCAVHWPALPGCQPAEAELAGRLLTLPTDFRYDREDMEKIASILANA